MRTIDEAILDLFAAMHEHYQALRRTAANTTISYRFDIESVAGSSIHYRFSNGVLTGGGAGPSEPVDVWFRCSLDDFISYGHGVVTVADGLHHGSFTAQGDPEDVEVAQITADSPDSIAAYIENDAWFHDVLMEAIARWLALGEVDIEVVSELQTAFTPNRTSRASVVNLVDRLAAEVRSRCIGKG